MPKRASKPPLTVAFAGTGSTNVEKKNVEALLDDYVKGREFFALIPEPGPKRGEKGVRNVWSWLDENEHQYDQEALTDIVPKLLEYKKEGDEVQLVLAWDEEDPTEPIETLMAAALDADIPVKDLCRALDDLEFDDGTAASAEEEDKDEPVYEKPARPARGKARQTGRSKSEAKSEPADEAQAEIETAVAAQDAALPLRPAEIMAQALYVFVAEMLKDVYGLEPKAKPKVAVLYHDENDTYRLAEKGRPRRGEARMEIEHDEAVKLGLVD